VVWECDTPTFCFKHTQYTRACYLVRSFTSLPSSPTAPTSDSLRSSATVHGRRSSRNLQFEAQQHRPTKFVQDKSSVPQSSLNVGKEKYAATHRQANGVEDTSASLRSDRRRSVGVEGQKAAKHTRSCTDRARSRHAKTVSSLMPQFLEPPIWAFFGQKILVIRSDSEVLTWVAPQHWREVAAIIV
jgi:hypothetical protein